MVSGLITIGIFLVVQLVAAVWWASSINTKMNFMIQTASIALKDLNSHVVHDLETFHTKVEAAAAFVISQKDIATAFSIADKQIQAIWKKLDLLMNDKKDDK